MGTMKNFRKGKKNAQPTPFLPTFGLAKFEHYFIQNNKKYLQ
jgi:hypothetical protein